MLTLLPNLLAPEAPLESAFVPAVRECVERLDGLIAESPKGGRAFLRHFARLDLPQALLNEHSRAADLEELLVPLRRGERWGLVSDCGLPCLGDPGAELVLRCRNERIAVEALPGPSSIPLALMLSGLPSQTFSFHGYLERDPERLKAELLRLQRHRTIHLFIETPYRNERLLTTLLDTLTPTTLLSLAWDLTAPTQGVETRPIRSWRVFPRPLIARRPTLFLFFPA